MTGLEELGLLGLFLGTFLAATIFPFSSDALYLAVLAATDNPIGCLLVGTAGNWLGSVLSFWIGWIGKWEWIEKWFKVKPETLQKQKAKIDRYGVWLALICWVPIIGDVIAIALGFYKTRPVWSILLMTGYLAYREKKDGNDYCLAIPNMEIRNIFVNQIMAMFKSDIAGDGERVGAFCDALESGNAAEIEKLLAE